MNQLKEITSKNADVNFTNYWEHKKNKKIFKKSLNAENIHSQILNSYPIIPILTVLMRSDIFLKKNFSFNENFEIIGDFDLIL